MRQHTSQASRDPRHRRLVVLRGSATETAAEAARLLAACAPEDVLWISHAPPPDPRLTATRPGRPLQKTLGRSFDAVVVDAHAGVQADVWGQSHGFVWGGGALILRLPLPGELGVAGRGWLAASPHTEADVTTRFARHLERALSDAHNTTPPVTPPRHELQGTAEQERAVRQLARLIAGESTTPLVLLADRGRGKSSALGLALREVFGTTTPPPRVVVTASSRDAALEVLRFASQGDEGTTINAQVAFVPARDLFTALEERPAPEVILVDEAAQLPVPWLQRLVALAPHARLAMATTARGYEGTGRGFVLRFLEWLRRERGVETVRMEAPIRWAADDPVEALMFRALLLDAAPAPLLARDDALDLSRVVHEQLDRDALVADEALLRQVFGLLVHAHYRTTPGDLHRMLDAPNMHIHTLRLDGAVVAVSLLAREGALDPALCASAARGATRIRAHALADTLVAHMGEVEAGALRMIRSVRTAVHPALRRRGLAARLVSAIHAQYKPDLFGTVFGATPALLRFRRATGYELMRLSASRGTRTGEPAVMMLRPVSPRARALCTRLRARLARDLPAQLALFAADDALILSDTMRDALRLGLPAPEPYTQTQHNADLSAYAFGPRTLESVIATLRDLLAAHPDALARAPASDRALLTARIIHAQSWRAAAHAANLPTIPAAMRAARRAVRAIVLDVAPELAPGDI